MSGHDADAGDGVLQRVVSAADGSPLHTQAASSVFNWRGAGAAAPAGPEPTTAGPKEPPPEKEETMATKRERAARAKKTDRGTPQRTICTLLAKGDLSREAIAEACGDYTSAQISSALNNAKQHDRIEWIEATGKYALTKSGLAWIGGASEKAPRTKGKRGKAHRKGAQRRQRKTKEQDVDTSPQESASEPTFRCAVMSDGSFFLSKDEQAIELDPDEHRQMLRYLERMAVDETAAA